MLLMLPFIGQAQLKTELYKWEENPVFNQETNDTSMQAIYLQKNIIKEQVYEKDDLMEYHLTNNRIKLLTKRALENFKVVYIPKDETSKPIREAARVLKSNGQIVILNTSDIKEGMDEESKKAYRYFVFEDLSVGDEIEYLFVVRQIPDIRGFIIQAQSNYPVLSYHFDLYTQPNLIYKFKTTNGLTEIQQDTSITDYNHWYLQAKSIPRLREEMVSNYLGNLQCLHYALDRNLATGNRDVTSYGPYAKDVYNFAYLKDKKLIAQFNKLIKTINPPKGNEVETIRAVEDYIKSKFVYTDVNLDALSDPAYMLANKAYNDLGALILFTNLYKQLGIKHEIVITTDRTNVPFDPEFESFTYLDHFLLYFPSIQKFMVLSDLFSRMGIPTAKYCNNYGLFVKEVSVSGYETGIGKVKFIPELVMEVSQGNIEANLQFSEDLSETKIIASHTLSGYNAMYYQPVFQLITDPKNLEDFRKETANFLDLDDEPVSFEFENDKSELFGIKPFIVKSTYQTDFMIEKAGDTYLLKAGLLIGSQMELYDTLEARKTPLELPYNHRLDRKLIIQTPNGYTWSNLEELVYDVSYIPANSDTAFAFVSSYTMQDNQLIINIHEWYHGVNWPKEVWDDYRKVINAAANFNKIRLILQPAKKD